MKRGFKGVPRPLLPAMLSVVSQSAGPENQSVTQPPPSSSGVQPPPTSQPAPPTPIVETTTASPSPSPSPEHETMEHTFEQPSHEHQPPSPRQESDISQPQAPTQSHSSVAGHMTVDALFYQDFGGFVTPSKTTVNALGEEQVKDISPTTLEASKTLSKKVDTGLDFEEEVSAGLENINSGFNDAQEVNTGIKGVNTSSITVSTGSGPVSTDSIRVSIPFPDKSQREGKALMIIEEAPKKTKEQILQEEASLAEAIRLDTLEKEEEAKQVYVDSLLAQRIAEEEELTEQQKQRRDQSVLGSDLQEEDFAKKMVELVNQRKKHFAKEKAKARRSKPMTQSLLKTYMMNYLKNQGTWKLTQLKNLSFEEIKEEFDKLVKQMEYFVDDKDAQPTEENEVKDDEPTKKTGKRRKQIARKGLHSENTDEDESKKDEESEKDHSTSAMLKDITRDDLIELYRIVMKKYGLNEPEDEHEKVFWEYLKNVFDAPLSTDQIWSLPGQQMIICCRYYGACRVHCLNLESADIYMLTERSYPLSVEVCKAMLDKLRQKPGQYIIYRISQR
ncbi:hypothetical protein Tco_0942038 [Tanacetum coccineum]|uniref:Uncharacterized protein n=1 Tax=Tanacetum coccineum TaxID=301880 RepID=A0ABQ5DTF7_9ASTR